MPVDKDVLKETIREAFKGDEEAQKYMEQKLQANDDLAANFVGGYMRDRDYRTKTQGLAEDRRTAEAQATEARQQVEQYRRMLEAAEGEKAKVLQDLGKHRESLSGAYARLQHIKDTYQLSDEDIPSYKDLIDTKVKGKPVDSSADVDAKFAAFKEDIAKYISDRLVPELGGMAELDIVWSDIRDEHRELTGKRLNAKEQKELLSEADRRNRAGKPTSLKALWEEKYDAPALRQKHHDSTFEKELRAKWDAEQQAKLSEAAMAGIHPTAPHQEGLRTSHIFDHKFQVHEGGAGEAPKPREVPSAAERQRLGGAERATQRWIERRANGIPMGAPDERKATKVG